MTEKTSTSGAELTSLSPDLVASWSWYEQPPDYLPELTLTRAAGPSFAVAIPHELAGEIGAYLRAGSTVRGDQ